MADPLFINASAGAPAYSANELRQAMALALMYGGRNMGARAGVRPGGNQLQVSYAAPTITVQPGLCYLDPALSTPQGGYWVAIPVAETFTLTPADATNPRKDIIIARVYDHDEDASGLRLARTEYLVGVPNPAPSEPAVPAGAIKLALLDVPASPGAVVVTDTRPWTVGPGGILPVAAAADIAAAVEGRYRDRLDLNLLERDSGTVWETVADPTVFTAWTDFSGSLAWSASVTNPVPGNATLNARYKKIGKTVIYVGRIVMGSTTTYGSGDWRVNLPVAALGGATSATGGGLAIDSSLSTNSRPMATELVTTTTIRFYSTTGRVDATNPFTWATSDELRWYITYEAA